MASHRDSENAEAEGELNDLHTPAVPLEEIALEDDCGDVDVEDKELGESDLILGDSDQGGEDHDNHGDGMRHECEEEEAADTRDSDRLGENTRHTPSSSPASSSRSFGATTTDTATGKATDVGRPGACSGAAEIRYQDTTTSSQSH